MSEKNVLGGHLPGGGLTYHEWHAFVDGFYSGFVWGHRQSDYDEEKHYWRTGYVLGTTGRYAGLAVAYKKLTDD
jgi:hypothetical protein